MKSWFYYPRINLGSSCVELWNTLYTVSRFSVLICFLPCYKTRGHCTPTTPSTCSCRVVAEASTKRAQNASYARGEKGEKNEFFFRSSLNATCACLVLASVRLRKAKMFTPVLKATWQPFYRSRWNATVLYGNCITMRDIHLERLCKGFNWIISISYNDGIPQSVC